MAKISTNQETALISGHSIFGNQKIFHILILFDRVVSKFKHMPLSPNSKYHILESIVLAFRKEDMYLIR